MKLSREVFMKLSSNAGLTNGVKIALQKGVPLAQVEMWTHQYKAANSIAYKGGK